MRARYLLPAAFIWLYLYSFPYFPKIHSANELPRVYLTRAMVDHGTFAIDSGVARWGTTVDVSPAHGHFYSNKAPGSSFLAAPAYLALKAAKALVGAGEPTLAETVWLCRVFTGVLPTLLFLVLLARFLARFARPPDTPGDADTAGRDALRLAIIGYGLGSMAMAYSVLFIAHQLSAVCLGSAYILSVRVIEDRRDPRWLLAAGFLAGCGPLVDYQAAFAGIPLAVYLLVKLGRARRFRDLTYAVAGSLPPIALLLAYHQACFGSPFKTGYDFSQTFAHFHQQGFLGITELRMEAFYGSTFAPDNGLFVFCPMLLLAIPGFYVLARRKQYWHLAVSLSVMAIYLAFISSINFWRGGWQLGPRYITVMLPFAMVPVTAALSELCRPSRLVTRILGRALAVALVVVGVVIYAVSSAVFPHFPEKFHNPLYELIARLVRDGHAPDNLGRVFGLSGLASLLPYFLVLAAMLAWMALARPAGSSASPAEAPGARRDRLISGALGLALAAAILAAYSLFDHGGAAAERAYRWVTTVFPR